MIAARPSASPLLATRLGETLGDALSADPAERAALAIGGIAPALVARPRDVVSLAACVRAIAAADAALVPLGRGAHRALGHAPARYDVALATGRLARVVEYAPADMTITVEAGITLTTLAAALSEERQWLPLDPPLPAETTVGGLVAADLGGPLTASQGRVRDLLIGIGFVTADGRVARAGGKVVKNVAGYDLMKLLTGSLGTLAIVTEATFKVRPRPAVERCLVLGCADAERALDLGDAVARGDVAPLAAVVCLERGMPARVVARLGGVEADVVAARRRLLDLAAGTGTELILDAGGDEPRVHDALATIRDPLRDAPARCSVVARMAVLPRRARSLAAECQAVLEGALATSLVDAQAGSLTVALDPPDPGTALVRLGDATRAHQAHLVVERWPAALAASIEVWSPLPSALPLMRRVKAALDPHGTLAPGRFVGRI